MHRCNRGGKKPDSWLDSSRISPNKLRGKGTEDISKNIILVEQEKEWCLEGTTEEEKWVLGDQLRELLSWAERMGGYVHSDARISEVAILKAALPVSLSHLVWTVHISPSISLTCRFFSISSNPLLECCLSSCYISQLQDPSNILPCFQSLFFPNPIFSTQISDWS